MRRVRAMRKLYKENLLQTLMEKDKRFKTIRKMKRDPTSRSMLAD